MPNAVMAVGEGLMRKTLGISRTAGLPLDAHRSSVTSSALGFVFDLQKPHCVGHIRVKDTGFRAPKWPELFNRKDKCDGVRPTCSTCASTGQPCSYEATTKKRGLPEGYVRGLEKLWAVSICKIEGLEEAVGEITVQHQQELLQIWNHDVIGEDLHMTWKESKVLHDLEHLLSGLERESSTGMKRKRGRDEDDEEEASEDTEPSFHRQVQYRITEVANEEKVPVKKRRRSQPSLETQQNVPLPATASKLLDHYFAYTHCWFPILDRPQILRTRYEQSRKQKTDNETSADLAVLWAIFAYTAQQAPDPKMVHSDMKNGDHEPTPADMRAMARGLIPNEKGVFEIANVQALLLIILFDIGLGDWNSAWVLVGFATRIALELGLGRTSPEKRGVSVLHGCFMLDTLIASHLSRTPHLRRSDIRNIGYSEEDGHEEWEPWIIPGADHGGHREPAFTISCFNRLVDVFLILNDIVTYDPHSGESRNTFFEERSEMLRALQNRYPFPMSSLTSSPPHQVYLRLFHLSAMILVLKQSYELEAPMAKLACDVLKLMMEYAQSPSLGLHQMASIVESPIRAACHAAITTKPFFSSSPVLPSYHAFTRKMSENISAISATWPVFSSLSGLWQKELQLGSQSGEMLSSSIGSTQSKGDWRNGFPFLEPQAFNASALSADWGAGHRGPAGDHDRQESRSSQLPVQMETFRSWSTPETNQMAFGISSMNSGIPSRSSITAGSSTLADLDHNWRDVVIEERLDMPMSGVDQGSPASLVMPGTDRSHSLHGDEVDAIFHNLAHLDTTEWTNKREQGLKEFGFADDSTFQAFCNDPERFVTSAGGFAQSTTETTDFWPTASWPLPEPPRRDGYSNLG